MSVFTSPQEHAENPPESWRVVKVAERCWHLTTAAGTDMGESFTTKRAAEDATRSGFLFNLYEKETRWYAGELIPGWRPYHSVTS